MDSLEGMVYICGSNESMEFLKKNWANLLLIGFILIMILPQTRKPVQIALNRIISFSPSVVDQKERDRLESYSWKLVDMDGRQKDFSYSSGRVAIVNLWATWCPPCIAEMPSFQKLYRDYGERVDFYFVSSEDPERLQRFMEKNQYELPVYLPRTAGPEELQTNSLPTTYVISKTGELVVQESGSANWNAVGFRRTLDGLLSE